MLAIYAAMRRHLFIRSCSILLGCCLPMTTLAQTPQAATPTTPASAADSVTNAVITPKFGGKFDDYPAFPSNEVAPHKVRVWLPPEYVTAKRTRFAVVYMQDGQNLFDPSASTTHGAWEIDRHIIALRKANRIRPTIVVAIWNSGDNRSRDYGPQAPLMTVDAELRALTPRASADASREPLSDAYLRFMVKELKPYIDSHYRTKPDRDNTFVVGSSMGALFSLYALSNYPDVFGGAGCLSTHWIMATNPVLTAPTDEPRIDILAKAYRDWLQVHLPKAGKHRLYFDHGTAELDAKYGVHQDKIDLMLAEKGYRPYVDWVSRVFPGANHNEAMWRSRVDIPLEFLLRK